MSKATLPHTVRIGQDANPSVNNYGRDDKKVMTKLTKNVLCLVLKKFGSDFIFTPPYTSSYESVTSHWCKHSSHKYKMQRNGLSVSSEV